MNPIPAETSNSVAKILILGKIRQLNKYVFGYNFYCSLTWKLDLLERRGEGKEGKVKKRSRKRDRRVSFYVL